MLSSVSSALKAFHAATVELGVSQSVVTFTQSDFGRTLTSNGDGSDHGWGGVQLVVGDAVLGQAFYGYEQRAAGNGHGHGIRSPFRFALSRCQDAPPPEYLELARLPPADLAEVLLDETLSSLGASLSDPARRLAGKLRRADLLAVVQEAGNLPDPAVRA